jgi:hypothetical protein
VAGVILFQLSHPDFFGPLTIAGLLCVGATASYLLLKRQADTTILLAVLLLFALPRPRSHWTFCWREQTKSAR